MCGIAGILSSDIDLRGEKLLVEKMGKTLKKRGPDAAGRYRDEECFSHFFSRISSMLWDGL